MDKARRDFDNIVQMCNEAEREKVLAEKTIKDTEAEISALRIQLSVTEESLINPKKAFSRQKAKSRRKPMKSKAFRTSSATPKKS